MQPYQGQRQLRILSRYSAEELTGPYAGLFVALADVGIAIDVSCEHYRTQEQAEATGRRLTELSRESGKL